MLNAGKNKLQKMDEVCSLTSLKALILNGERSFVLIVLDAKLFLCCKYWLVLRI